MHLTKPRDRIDNIHESITSIITEMRKMNQDVEAGCTSVPHPFIQKSNVPLCVWYAAYSSVLQTRRLELSSGAVVEMVMDVMCRVRPAAPLPPDAAVRLAPDGHDIPCTLFLAVTDSLCVKRALSGCGS